MNDRTLPGPSVLDILYEVRPEEMGPFGDHWCGPDRFGHFVKQRVAKMISRRNKRRDITWKLFADRALYEKYGLYKLNNLGRKFA